MLNRMKGILAGIQVYPDRMKENIGKSYGLFCSQRVLLKLTENGLSREDAYKVVQARAMESWKQKVPYKDLLKKDKIITKYLSAKEIDKLFDMKFYTKNVDFIYKRVFGSDKTSSGAKQ
jgi:adenylosuccinate lyase